MEPVLHGAGLLGLSAGGTGSAGLPQEGEGRASWLLRGLPAQDAAPSQGVCRAPASCIPTARGCRTSSWLSPRMSFQALGLVSSPAE